MYKDRYASAVNSSNLSVKAETTYSDTDVLTAMGLAARHHPLGAALQRLFVDGKARECVDLMAKMARDHSFKIKARMTPFQSQRMAEKVLAWYRHGVCTECGGGGKVIVLEPRPHQSEEDCPHCYGFGRRPFAPNFSAETLQVARWLKGEVSKHQALAGKAAMQLMSPSLDL